MSDHPTEAANPGSMLRVVEDLSRMRAEDASGVGIGRTVGALAERDSGLVRYLDVAVTGSGTHVLVPIGHVRFLREDRDEPEVRLRAALLEDLERIPDFDPSSTDLDDPYEQALLHAHGLLFHGERYYAHPAFDHAGLFMADRPLVPPVLAEQEEAEELEAGTETAGGRPAAPAGDRAVLLPLGELEGWHVAEGEADVRGWGMRAGGGPAGTVRELIVQPSAARARYLAVDVAEGAMVLLPVGFLRVDREAEVVTAPGLEPGDLSALPRWSGGPVDRALEEEVRRVLDELLVEERRYARPDFAPPADDL